MRKYVRCLSSALTLLLILNTTSYAWNARGHMMVAAVAYDNLTQAKKNRVEVLLKKNPDRVNWLDLIPAGTSATQRKKFLFMIAATWADRIKQDPDYFTDGTHGGNRPPIDGSGMVLPSASQNIGFDDLARHKYWHFVDLPFSLDSTTMDLIVPNAQTQMILFRAVFTAPTSTANNLKLKSYDLSWFLHLIGDVHQPLHCVTRISADDPEGDDGGNGVELNGSPNNLHSFWDGTVGTGGTLTVMANAAAALPAAPTADVNNLNIADWVQESFDLAKSNVYQLPVGSDAGPFTLDNAYKTSARALAKKRIALAGARLAKILNDELN